MARKIRTRRNVGRSPKGYARRPHVNVEVERRGRAFLACAWLRHGGGRSSNVVNPGGPRGYFCAFGRNPRSALAGAFVRLAGSLRKRSGAFAGVR